jgi:mono/diheme cytochrome c family protein
MVAVQISAFFAKMSNMNKTTLTSLILLLAIALFAAPCLSSNSGDAKKGQEIFESLTCVDCHKGGLNSVHPSKPLRGESFAKKYAKDSQIEKVIRKGVSGTSMAGFNVDVISEPQMKDLIAYLRSLTPACETKSKSKSSQKQKTGSK